MALALLGLSLAGCKKKGDDADSFVYKVLRASDSLVLFSDSLRADDLDRVDRDWVIAVNPCPPRGSWILLLRPGAAIAVPDDAAGDPAPREHDASPDDADDRQREKGCPPEPPGG